MITGPRVSKRNINVHTRESSGFLHDRTQGLPPEIVAKILGNVSSTTVNLLPPQNRSEYPWVLGHICARWREILWSSVDIWHCIRIGHENPDVRQSYAPQVWKRTIRESLSYIISHTMMPISLEVPSEEMNHVSDIILAQPHRFTALQLFDASNEFLQSLLNLPFHSFSALEKILITLVDDISITLDHINTSLETAPCLRTVLFSTNSTTYTPQILRLPWNQLTVLFIKTMKIPPLVVCRILMDCPSLTACFFAIAPEDIPNTSHVTLENLESLELETEQYFNWESFLALFSIPPLEHLFMSSTSIPITAVTSLITRSKCDLMQLSLCLKKDDPDMPAPTDDTNVNILMTHLPLVVLSLSLPYIMPPSVFRRIQDGLLPFLTELHVYVLPEGFEAFLDMVDGYVDGAFRQVQRFRWIRIECYEAPGFTEVRDRYLARLETYNAIEQLTIDVTNGSRHTTMAN